VFCFAYARAAIGFGAWLSAACGIAALFVATLVWSLVDWTILLVLSPSLLAFGDPQDAAPYFGHLRPHEMDTARIRAFIESTRRRLEACDDQLFVAFLSALYTGLVERGLPAQTHPPIPEVSHAPHAAQP